MHCPLCVDTDLDPVFRSGIEIDRCPQCKGLWLDRGELDTGLRLLPRGRLGPSFEERPDDGDEHGGNRKRQHPTAVEHSAHGLQRFSVFFGGVRHEALPL